MPDANDYIRRKLRLARAEMGLSQREVAEQFGAAQVTISDMERGRSRISAADLIRLATILHKSVLYFLPSVQQSDLDDEEQALLSLFRQFHPSWRANILEMVSAQLEFYRDLTAVEYMPDGPDKDRAMLEYRAKVWQADGVWVVRDPEGTPGVVATDFPQYVNMLLSDDRYEEAALYIDTLPEERQGEAAYVMLYGMLAPHGVDIYPDENGRPVYDDSEAQEYAATQGEQFGAVLPRLTVLARAPVHELSGDAEHDSE